MASSPNLHEVFNLSPGLFMVLMLIGSILLLAMAIFFVVVFCKLFHKMGHHWALGFLSLVPLAASAILAYMAFSRWPVQDELDRLRAAAGTPTPPDPSEALSPRPSGPPAPH